MRILLLWIARGLGDPRRPRYEKICSGGQPIIRLTVTGFGVAEKCSYSPPSMSTSRSMSSLFPSLSLSLAKLQLQDPVFVVRINIYRFPWAKIFPEFIPDAMLLPSTSPIVRLSRPTNLLAPKPGPSSTGDVVPGQSSLRLAGVVHRHGHR